MTPALTACSSLLILVVASACNRGADAPPLPPGLVLELAFEDGCQPVAAAELSAKVPPSGITFGDGVEGRAARFDGSGAVLQMRGLDRLGISDALTLEFFVDLEDWQNPYRAGSGLESMVSHSDIFTVAVDPHSWELQARVTTTASEDSERLHGGKLQPGAWHHVALVIDGAQGKALLVLDGDQVDEIGAKGSVPVRSNLDLDIGTWFQKNQAFCGKLDSIRLWKRALSADELRARAKLVASPRPSSN